MAIIVGFLLMFVFVDVGLTVDSSGNAGKHVNEAWTMLCESMDFKRDHHGDCDGDCGGGC